MAAPRLNRRLILEAPARSSDGVGGFTTSWLPLGTLWAEVTARTGRETIERDAPVSQMRYRIVVRNAPYGSVERPKPDQRFKEDERFFLIRAVAEFDPEGRYLSCFATEETAL